MRIHPFAALRPADNNRAARIASLPYDVMNTAEARAMADGNPLSFLHVVRSEIDLPADTDSRASTVYDQAAAALAKLEADGQLVREATPSLYLYRQIWRGFAQTAVVACCEVADYLSGERILRHEKTRKEKEDDRTDHILRTRAHTGQVFLCYEDRAEIDTLVAAEMKAPPLFDFTSDDGVEHAVWRVLAPEFLRTAFESVPRAYIADGHHRCAASGRAAQECAAHGDAASAESQRVMACLFPASQLRILPYHRCVRDLNGLDPQSFLKAAVARGFSASACPALDQLQDHSCAVRLADGVWYRLSWSLTPEQAADPVARLDATRLQEDLLAPILGIGDPRTDERIWFVGGIRGIAELEREVAGGHAAAAFAMRPAVISDMTGVADAGLTMPPKSTWFEPKLRSGLLVHTF